MSQYDQYIYIYYWIYIFLDNFKCGSHFDKDSAKLFFQSKIEETAHGMFRTWDFALSSVDAITSVLTRETNVNPEQLDVRKCHCFNELKV